MSTETTNKKIKIDNGTTFGKTYTDKAVDERLQGLVSTATFTPVKEKANNSLQKPAGLTKTELVGVGTNGQENIEIGDNLTLANGKLSAMGGGSIGLESDAEGNLTASKNLKVSGNLELDGSIINKIYKGNDNPTGEMFTTIEKFHGETVHLTQVGDSNSAAGGYPNSWYGRPVRDQNHGCLEVVYSRNKTYLDYRWIQLQLYRHFLKITNGGSLIIINPVHTTQTRCTTPGGLTRLIPGGAIANGIIINQDGSSSQVIAIEIQDGKPQALLAGGATVDISSYKISDTVSDEKYFYND